MTDFLTPIGRLVQGDCFAGQTKDMSGKPLVDRNGNPKTTWFIGVAYEKSNPEFANMWALMNQAAREAFPHLFDAQGNCTARNFAWKLIDGDGYDESGKPWSSREGFAGHYILRFTSGFAPSCYHAGRYDPSQRITDPNQLKRGYYVRVGGSIAGNSDPQKPGIYLNFNLVELAGFGPEIVGGPDASKVFAQQTGYVPQGMQQTPASAPQGPGGLAMPGAPIGVPGVPAPGMVPAPTAPAPQLTMPAPQVQQSPIVPNHGFVQNALSGVPAPGMVPAPTAPAPQLTMPAPQVQQAPQMGANAGGHSYEAWRAQGYTDEQLRAAGVIL